MTGGSGSLVSDGSTMPGPVDTTSANSSLWLAANQSAVICRLTGEIWADVAVLGGGIAGVTTALALQRAG